MHQRPLKLPEKILMELAREYARILQEQLGDHLTAVVLFGSVARGEGTPASDIDVLIVVSGLPPQRLARYEWLRAADDALESHLLEFWREGLRADISPILKTPEEATRVVPLYLDMVDDAVILYERDGYFSAILEKVRHSLERLGARRKRQGKTRYWEIKPDLVLGEVFAL